MSHNPIHLHQFIISYPAQFYHISSTILQPNKHVGQRLLFGHLTTQLLILIPAEKAAVALERSTLRSFSEDKCLYFHDHAEGMPYKLTDKP